jgi:hypothetical protein
MESYQKCSYSRTVLFLNQAGIAMGNASLLAPVAALLVIVVFYFLSRYFAPNMASSSPYSRVEIERANYSLGLALLLARDGKIPLGTKSDRAIDDKEVMQQVIQTLSQDGSVVNDPKLMGIIKELYAELSCLSAQRGQQHAFTKSGTADTANITIRNPILNDIHTA